MIALGKMGSQIAGPSTWCQKDPQSYPRIEMRHRWQLPFSAIGAFAISTRAERSIFASRYADVRWQ
jgi:hypothetical protein